MRPSKIFLALFVAFNFLVVLSWSQFSHGMPSIKVFGALAITLLFCYGAWRYIFLASPESWIGFQGATSLNWSIISRKGKVISAVLRKDTQIYPWLISLRFNVEGYYCPITITLFKDSLSHTDWRRLRVLLGWSISLPS